MTASATNLRLPELEPHFAAVYAEHVDYVWTNLRRLGVPPPELDDAVQETFLVVFRRWDDFREHGSWRPWLFGIARRVASKHRRGSGRRLRLVEAAKREPVVSTHPDDEVARRDAVRLVQHFLQQLGPRKREVFILAEIEGRTGAQIAQSLDIKPNTVWSRLRASRERFERYLQTLRAREQGAAERYDRAALLDRARGERAPEPARRKVLAALGMQMATSPGSASVLAALKPIALALGLGTAGIAAIGGVARMTRPSAPDATTLVAPRSTPTTGPLAARRAAATSPTRPVETIADPTVDRTPTTIVVPPPTVARSHDPASPPAPTKTSGAETLRAEVALLQQMRLAAQAGQHATVLSLASQHDLRFAGGALAVERDVQRIASLCRLGQSTSAQRRIAAFGQEHRSVALPRRVQLACGIDREKPTNPDAPGQEG